MIGKHLDTRPLNHLIPQPGPGARVEPVRPPVHLVREVDWFWHAPVEPGYYWFFGDQHMGECGGHFTGVVQPENRLCLVEVFKISNGIMAQSGGQFFNLHKWDGKVAGHLGRWAQATIPDVAESI